MPGVADMVRAPADLPAPIGAREPQQIKVDLETVELAGHLDDGATYRYWTFNRKVPGPFVRVRVGDTVEVHLKNAEDSVMIHNVDFHAVTGPGGGANATGRPGQAERLLFKALKPGLYVYHCATPMGAQHIANGMYGLILVEPEEACRGRSRVLRHAGRDLYRRGIRHAGELTESYDKLINERPEYFVFNGASERWPHRSHSRPRRAKRSASISASAGRTHVVVPRDRRDLRQRLRLGSLTGTPLNNVQTYHTSRRGHGCRFQAEVPGKYILVDHALTRAERGLVGILEVEGPENPEVFRQLPQQSAAAN